VKPTIAVCLEALQSCQGLNLSLLSPIQVVIEIISSSVIFMNENETGTQKNYNSIKRTKTKKIQKNENRIRTIKITGEK